MYKHLVIFFSLIIGFVFLFAPSLSFAQTKEEHFEAVVTSIQKNQGVQRFEVLLTTGKEKGKKVVVESGEIQSVVTTVYHVGDKVMLTANYEIPGKTSYFIADFIRHDALFWLFGLFLGVVLLIGGRRGASSLVGMAFSFAVIFMFVLPQISAGQDPILIAILASCVIIPVTFFLSHGINAKTSIAMLSTLTALVITGILANIFVDAAKLTGFSSDEAAFLANIQQGSVNIKDLLLAGIIIGAIGVLDDITVAQSALIFQLKKASSQLSFKELFMRGMDVGKDHIASLVNTLVLIYTGAALPLLLLFINNPQPFSQLINYEMIAEEIVRTLVASIGLILAVPITTLLASLYNDLHRRS